MMFDFGSLILNPRSVPRGTVLKRTRSVHVGRSLNLTEPAYDFLSSAQVALGHNSPRETIQHLLDVAALSSNDNDEDNSDLDVTKCEPMGKAVNQ